jgi:hypothetical protein
VIAISQSTKQDLIEFAGVDADRIDVACPGNSLVPRPDAVAAGAGAGASAGPGPGRAAGERPYLIFVGQRPSYKNFANCLRGVADLLIRRDLALRCIGGSPFDDEELALIRSLSVDGRVAQETLTDAALALA